MVDARPSKDNQKKRSDLVHVVLRIAASVNIGHRQVNVIDAHNALVEQHGRVAFGKFGQPIAGHLEDRLAKQISEGRETRLYLVSKHDKEFITYLQCAN